MRPNLKNTKYTMKLCNIKTVAALGGLLLAHQAAVAATATWNSSTNGALWTVPGNWTGDLPAGNPVVFSSVGRTTSSTTVGNVVDDDISITSLSYINVGSWQVTSINSDITLTLSGGTGDILSVGSNARNTVQAAITGAGKLLIDQSDANIRVSSRSDLGDRAVLDMSGLASFEAAVDNIYVGRGSDSTNSSYQGSLALAVDNKITANSLLIGSPGSASSVSQVFTGAVTLGASNELSINRIDVGSQQGLGTLAFASGLEDAIAVIQGRDSTAEVRTRAELNVGYTSGGGVTALGGTVDFTGGEIDAYLSTLRLGVLTGNSATALSGAFLMNSGTVDVQSVIIAQKTNASATSAASGSLDVAGGTFTTGTLSMAQQAGTSGSATASLNIHGTGQVSVTGGGILMGNTGTTTATVSVADSGKLTVSGDIAKGAGTTNATLNLDGGTLEMNGHNVTVDAFDARSGTLRNLGDLNGGGALTKTTTGMLAVEGANTWTGETIVNAGTLLVNGTHTGGGAYTVNDGGTLGGEGTITTAGNAGVTLAAGGKLSPGDSPGTMTLNLGSGVLNISDGVAATASEALIFELGSSSDLISLSGTLDIGFEVLEFSDFGFQNIAGFAPGTYTLFNTNNTILGTLGTSLTGFVGGYEATLSFANGGQDLILSVVPEPSSFAMATLALGLGSLLWRKRRA